MKSAASPRSRLVALPCCARLRCHPARHHTPPPDFGMMSVLMLSKLTHARSSRLAQVATGQRAGGAMDDTTSCRGAGRASFLGECWSIAQWRRVPERPR